MKNILTFGSATIDIFLDTKNKLFIQKQSKSSNITIPFGSKIKIDECRQSTGGGGTNTAANFSTLGLNATYIGKVGTDNFADVIINDLKKFNVNTKYIKREQGSTALSIILDSTGHDRTILTHKGVADKLRPSEVTMNALSKAKCFYLSSLTGPSIKVAEKVSKYAKYSNKPLAFNPSSYMIQESRNQVLQIARNATWLICNKEEAELIAGSKGNLQKIIPKIEAKTKSQVIVTDGQNGAYYINKKLIHIPTHKVKVVETTGAGDAFASTFVTSMLKNGNIEESIRYGIRQSESIISYYGAKNKFLSWRQLKK